MTGEQSRCAESESQSEEYKENHQVAYLLISLRVPPLQRGQAIHLAAQGACVVEISAGASRNVTEKPSTMLQRAGEFRFITLVSPEELTLPALIPEQGLQTFHR